MSRQDAAGEEGAADRGEGAQAEAIRALLQTVYERSGIDFRDYAYASLRRRVLRRMAEEGSASIAELHERVIAEPAALHRLLLTLTLPVTSMFRDPEFFREFRERAAPILRTHPFLRLWVAGCSTGQEVYSLAIVLHEEGLYERSRIYATELHSSVLEQAARGIYPLAVMQDYTRNYQAAGGKGVFSDYYTADSNSVILRPFLRGNLVFGVHNLVSDSSFNEFQVIFCRNVMIYFNRVLQHRVHTLLYESLARLGYLGLGRSETVHFSPFEARYEPISAQERLYRKVA